MMREYLPACYAIFACAGAGCLLGVCAGEWKGARAVRLARTAVLAAILIALGTAAVVSQFGRPAMVFAAFANTGSAIFRELVTLSLGLIGAVLYAGLLASGAKAATTKRAASAAALLALLMALAVGSTLVMSWRPAWNTWTLVLPSFGFALFAGAAAASALAALERMTLESAKGPAFAAILKAEAKTEASVRSKINDRNKDGCVSPCRLLSGLGEWFALLPVIGAAIYSVVIAVSGAADAVSRLYTGDASLVVWGGALFLGILIPAIALRIAKTARSASTAFVLASLAFLLISLGAGAWHLALGSLG